VLSQQIIDSAVSNALEEDLADGEDVTSVATISANQSSRAEFRTRKAGVIAGVPLAIATLKKCGVTDIQTINSDGSHVKAGEIILQVSGNTRSILLAERTALNFLCHLSGIATVTAQWVTAITGTKAVIRDTRKTTPGLRVLEKYAVRMGGGANHRMSLSDAALIKDNHIAAAGDIAQAFSAVTSRYSNLEVEVEVDTLEQLSAALTAGARFILLDNMTPDQCREAVKITNGRAKLEASGGLTLESARRYAETGVDYLAVGALTHSAPILDIGLDFLESSKG
jgi:nicotinate-nucleotide pyrophosphorylase (carboxylating)